MTRLTSRLLTPVACLALLSGSLVASAPTAHAASAPWTWQSLSSAFSVASDTYGTGTAQCPTDWVPIGGGLAPSGGLSNAYQIEPVNSYAQDGLVSGGRWHVTVYNYDSVTKNLRVIVNCIPASQLPAPTYVTANFGITEPGNHAEGAVFCPDGTIAVAGGVDWDNFTARWIEFSGPTTNGNGWYVIGHNSVSTAKLYVEAYCIDANDLPGLVKAQTEYYGAGDPYGLREVVATCPAGTRVLSGGTEVRFWISSDSPGLTFGSWPTLNSWHATTWDNLQGGHAYVRAWCVNAGSPSISLDYASWPDGSSTQARYVDFAVSGSDPAGSSLTWHCALDDATAVDCDTTPGYSSLADGVHHFTVWATTSDDRQSNVLHHSWTVDTTPPTVSLSSPARVTLASAARVAWQGSDQLSQVQSYAVRYREGAYNAPLGAWQEPTEWANLAAASVSKAVPPGTTMCFSVRAIDTAGNQSDWSPQRCTARPLDDRSLTPATSGWTRRTGTAYWLQTATSTTRLHARLLSSDAVLDRVGIVATRCPKCGRVGVFVGTTRVGSLDLYRAKKKQRAVLLLPGFTQVTAPVTLKVLTTDKPVIIDGLVVMKSS